MTARLGAALEALVAARGGARARVVDLRGRSDDDAVSIPNAVAGHERELIEAMRGGRGPDVIIVERPSATLRRALREHPVGLLVVTGTPPGAELEQLAAMTGQPWLGPAAVLGVGTGKAIAVGHVAGEITGLLRALGKDAVRLSLAPTPTWLPTWLGHDKLRGCTVLGTVAAAALDVAWASWARAAGGRDVVVPVGVPTPALDRPRAPELTVAVAAHALERHTGPVFPSPRVIALVHARLGTAAHGEGERDPAQLAVWAQARRALPVTGALVGMDAPLPGLPTDAPTAAFLAQRVLLREAELRAVLARGAPSPAPPPADGLARAREVLENAAEELSDQETKVVLRGLGLQVTRQAVASSASGAAGFAERIGFPVVLKALSPTLRRRAEIGAIELDLANAAAVRRAYAAIVMAVERRAPTARLDGIVVAEHVPGGLDVHAGLIRLESAQLAVFARPLAGDTTLEPLLALAPLGGEGALAMAHAVLSRIPVPALRRGSDPAAGPLAELLLRLSWLAEHFGERLQLVDCRPVRLTGDERGYVVLDAHLRQRAHLEGR